LDLAIETVRNSIHQNPSNLEARNLLAALFLAKRDFQAFEQEVKAILQLDPLDGRANYYLGRFEYDRKRFGEAREHLERARLVQPNDPLIATTLAMTYEGLGLNRQAEAEYKREIDRGRNGPRDASLYSNYGAFLLNQGRVAEAVTYLDDAVASPNVRTEVWYMAGIAHLQNGDLARAKHCLEKALERRRDYAEAHSALGSVLQKEGDTTGALREFALGKEAEDHAKAGGPKDTVVEDISLPQ
jgi:Tfp pilus assembly protein PilF